jgi:hypothetical protein
MSGQERSRSASWPSRSRASWASSGRRAPAGGSAGQRHNRVFERHRVEAALRWPHVAIGHVLPVISANPILVVAAGGTAVGRLNSCWSLPAGRTRVKSVS